MRRLIAWLRDVFVRRPKRRPWVAPTVTEISPEDGKRLMRAPIKRDAMLLLLCALTLACGGGSTAPAPTGTLIFRLDAQTCTGTGTLTFFLDGTTIGTATLSAGQSQSFPGQPTGQHVAGASETRAGGFTWAPQVVTIPPNASLTHVLVC